MKYIITGGGSGGHIYPALAIADKIKTEEPDAEFLYLGNRRRLESSIVPKRGYKIKFIRSSGYPGVKNPKFILFILNLILGILKTAVIMLKFRPDMIIATGGFVSAPVIYAADILKKSKLIKCKIFIHEANTSPGKMVKATAGLADGIGCAYKACLKHFPSKSRYVGFPVRSEFFSGSIEESRKKLGFSKDEFIVLSTGGSQGARIINSCLIEALPYLKALNKFKIIHGTGKNSATFKAEKETDDKLNSLKLSTDELKFYTKTAYIENIKDYYMAADIIICRGGAATLTELGVCGKPAIIIPKAGLSGDHQVINAEFISSLGGAKIIYEEVMLHNGKFSLNISGNKLAETIKELYNNREMLKNMSEGMKSSVKIAGGNTIYKYINDIKKGRNNIQKDINENVINPYAEKSSSSLVRMLTKKKDNITNENLNYIRYRASHYCISSSWMIRNNGVKLIGLTKDTDRASFLHHMFNDKRKAPVIEKLFGADSFQVGFIRRNILTAYKQLGIYNKKLEHDIFKGLNDSYYEVVSAAINCSSYFYDQINNKSELKQILLKKLCSKNFEIVLEAIKAMSKFISSYKEFDSVFNKFFFDKNPKIREMILKVLSDLNEKDILSDKEKNIEIADKMFLSSPSFLPVFNMKKILKNIN